MEITYKVFTNSYSADSTDSAKYALYDCDTDEPRSYKWVKCPLATHNSGVSEDIDAALIADIQSAP